MEIVLFDFGYLVSDDKLGNKFFSIGDKSSLGNYLNSNKRYQRVTRLVAFKFSNSILDVYQYNEDLKWLRYLVSDVKVDVLPIEDLYKYLMKLPDDVLRRYVNK